MCGIYTATRWLWSACWKQYQIFKLLPFPTDSSSSWLSWLLQFCVQLLDTGHSPPCTKGFSHLKNIGVNACINTKMTRVWSRLLGCPLFWFSITRKETSLCGEKSEKENMEAKKKVWREIFAKEKHGRYLPSCSLKYKV